MPGVPPINGLSVDVEDWFHVGAFEEVIERGTWDAQADRVERNCDQILDLFAEAEVSATFFTLGWVAQRHGALLRRIAAAGHEIASHGWDHARVFTMDAKSFAADLERSRKVLEDATGAEVIGYDDYVAMFHAKDERVDVHSLGLMEQLWTDIAVDLLQSPSR